MKILSAIVLALVLLFSPIVQAAEVQVLDWDHLSDKDISPQGKAALGMGREEWKHTQTGHFVYHFKNEKEAETLYVHGELYYQWIKELFGVSADEWAKKAHIFVFDDKAEWHEFLKKGGSPLEGDAFTNGWELFIYRNPYWLSPQKTLAHEMTHLIVFRFLDGPIPLFLNEGFAEFVSAKAVATQFGGSEYSFRTVPPVPEEKFIPLGDLVGMSSYPSGKTDVFYQESELLTRFLVQKSDSKNFYLLLHEVSRGKLFRSVVEEIYGMDFETLENEFKTFAVSKSTIDK